MNKGLFTERINEAFPGILAVEKPKVEIDTGKSFDPYWFAGFVDAEGCFYISVLASKSNKIGFSVITKFQVSQHSRDDQLVKSLITFFGCGKFYLSPSGDMGHFVISKFSDITGKIIPFAPFFFKEKRYENYPVPSFFIISIFYNLFYSVKYKINFIFCFLTEQKKIN